MMYRPELCPLYVTPTANSTPNLAGVVIRARLLLQHLEHFEVGYWIEAL